MIYAQPFFNNFFTIFSLILTLSFYSLSSFFSLYYFLPIKEGKIKVVIKIVPKSCTSIITLYHQIVIQGFKTQMLACIQPKSIYQNKGTRFSKKNKNKGTKWTPLSISKSDFHFSQTPNNSLHYYQYYVDSIQVSFSLSIFFLPLSSPCIKFQ